jgi:hypothetical protein
MENAPKPPRRVTVNLRSDLNERVVEKAAELDQNPNYFVNQCVEGILDAIDGEEIAQDIPILKLARIMKGKTLLDAKWVTALCSVFAPHAEEITAWHRRYFAELTNRHEGTLTEEFIKLYWKQAAEMTRQRIETEKQIARLHKSAGNAD